MGFIPHWQLYVQGRGAGLLPGAVVEAIPSGALGGRGGRLRAGLGSLWEQGKCQQQWDCLGAAGARLPAGVLHVLGALGNHRTTGASAVTSKEMGLSSSQHICFFRLGERGGEAGVENNHGVIVFLMRIL